MKTVRVPWEERDQALARAYEGADSGRTYWFRVREIDRGYEHVVEVQISENREELE